MRTSTAIAVVGLSDAGKSTWLGSLCDVMESSDQTRIQMDGLPDAFDELRKLRDVLNSGRYPGHTAFSHNSPLSFPLRWKDGKDERFTLDVSDYSGERVKNLYLRESHVWDEGWEERASRTRIALLLRADAIRRLERREAGRARQPSGIDDLIPAEHQPDDCASERHPPTALALIEAMQTMRARRRQGLGLVQEPGAERVAVILTAWDRVVGDSGGKGPEAFLGARAPLLAAWLRSNLGSRNLKVFGLSATGGDLKDETHAELVRSAGVASVGYVECDSPARRYPDVSLPLGWLLGP